LQILSQEAIFSTKDEIVQICCSKDDILISTNRDSFLFNSITKDLKKIGSKEKDGKFGSCFYRDSECVKAVCARSNGLIWVADAISGKVIKTLKFQLEPKEKLAFGKLYLFSGVIISITDDMIVFIDLREKILLDARKWDFKENEGLNNKLQSYILSSNWNDDSKEKNEITKEWIFLAYPVMNSFTFEKATFIPISMAFSNSLENNDLPQVMNLMKKFSGLQNIKNFKRFFFHCITKGIDPKKLLPEDLCAILKKVSSFLIKHQNNSFSSLKSQRIDVPSAWSRNLPQ